WAAGTGGPRPAWPVEVRVTRGLEVAVLGPARAGAAGTCVSLTKVLVAGPRALPAASGCATERVWRPSERASAALQVQRPPAVTCAWQTTAPESATVTKANASPLPENVGRFAPVGVGTGSTVGVPMLVFTRNRSGLESGEVPSSQAVPQSTSAVSRCRPSLSGVGSAHDHCVEVRSFTVHSTFP